VSCVVPNGGPRRGLPRQRRDARCGNRQEAEQRPDTMMIHWHIPIAPKLLTPDEAKALGACPGRRQGGPRSPDSGLPATGGHGGQAMAVAGRQVDGGRRVIPSRRQDRGHLCLRQPPIVLGHQEGLVPRALSQAKKPLGQRKLAGSGQFHRESMTCPNVLSTNLIPAQEKPRACACVCKYVRTHTCAFWRYTEKVVRAMRHRDKRRFFAGSSSRTRRCAVP